MPQLEGVEHRYVNVGGLRMHLAEAGPEGGEPLVLVHGWPQHWYAWRHLIAPLSQRYRVICPDLRGFGWTDAPPGEYLKRTLAADLVALLDLLELDRVRLVGHDWGGFVGFLVCLEQPQRVSHFAALAITHPWVRPEPGVAAALETLRRIAYMLLISSPLLGRQIVRRVPGFTRSIMRLSAVDPDRTWSDQELDAFVAQWREPDRAAACVSIYRTFLTRELKELASGAFRDARIEIPTLLFAGAGDPVIRPENLAGYERNAPRMRLETIADRGHWLPEEAPEQILEVLLPFLQEESAPVAPSTPPAAPPSGTPD